MRPSFSILFLIAMLSHSCGTDTTSLNIEMYGVSSIPTGATGDTSPKSLTLTVSDITLTSSDGSSVSILDSSEEFRIVDQSQYILQKAVSSLTAGTYTSLTVTFANDYTLNFNSAESISDTWDTATTSYTTSFDIESKKSSTFAIKVSWQNVVSGTSVTVDPSFEFIRE